MAREVAPSIPAANAHNHKEAAHETDPQHLYPAHTIVALTRSASPSPPPVFLNPRFPPMLLHLADIAYPESYLRTRIPQLAFEAAQAVEDEDEDVRESIEEVVEGGEEGEVWGDGTREWVGWREYRRGEERACEGSSRKRSAEEEEQEQDARGVRKKLKE